MPTGRDVSFFTILSKVKENHSVYCCRMRPGLAMSQDGLNWARIEGEHHPGALLDVGDPGEWDELFIASPQVHATCSRTTNYYQHQSQ